MWLTHLHQGGHVDELGNRPYLLHHALQKPWLEAMPSNAYSKLLPRYLQHPAAVAVEDRLLPRFLRAGATGDVARAARSARGHVRRRLRGNLGLRPRLAKLARSLKSSSPG